MNRVERLIEDVRRRENIIRIFPGKNEPIYQVQIDKFIEEEVKKV